MTSKLSPAHDALFPGHRYAFFLWVAAALLVSHRYWKLLTRELQPLILLFGWISIASVLGNVTESLRTLLIICVLTLGIYVVYRQTPILHMARVLMFFGSIMAAHSGLAITLLYWWNNELVLFGWPIVSQVVFPDLRIGGLYQHPNGLGAMSYFGIVALFGATTYTRSKLVRLVLVLLVLPTTYAQYLSGSRASIVATVTFLLVAGSLMIARWILRQQEVSKRKQAFLAVASVVAIMATGLWRFRSHLIGWVLHILFRGRHTLSGRELIWKRTIELFQEQPWFGVGFGRSAELIGNEQLNPHNLYLGMAAETGWIGALLTVVVLSYYLFKGIRSAFGAQSQAAGCLALCCAAALAGYMVHQLFEFQFLRVSYTHYYAIMIFAIVLSIDTLEGSLTSATSGPKLRRV